MSGHAHVFADFDKLPLPLRSAFVEDLANIAAWSGQASKVRMRMARAPCRHADSMRAAMDAPLWPCCRHQCVQPHGLAGGLELAASSRRREGMNSTSGCHPTPRLLLPSGDQAQGRQAVGQPLDEVEGRRFERAGLALVRLCGGNQGARLFRVVGQRAGVFVCLRLLSTLVPRRSFDDGCA